MKKPLLLIIFLYLIGCNTLLTTNDKTIHQFKFISDNNVLFIASLSSINGLNQFELKFINESPSDHSEIVNDLQKIYSDTKASGYKLTFDFSYVNSEEIPNLPKFKNFYLDLGVTDFDVRINQQEGDNKVLCIIDTFDSSYEIPGVMIIRP